MEELLNKLIEKGWKPRGEDVKVLNTGVNTFNERVVRFRTNKGGFKSWGGTYRELVSKESGLWQFVCENNLVEYDTESGWGEFSFRTDYINGFYGKHIFESNYQFRLIESALCDEDKLEEFLLKNINVND